MPDTAPANEPATDLAITAFFTLPPSDAAAEIERIFAADAHVNDEAHDHHGLPAIIDWWHETNRTTPFETSLLAVEQEGDARVAAAEVRGNFPGSPVVLHYRFRLREGVIADLHIAP